MAKVKSKSIARGSIKAAKPTEFMLTTAFMTDAGGVLPKGSVGFTLRATAKTVAMLADEPAKVKPVLKGYSDAFSKSRRAGRPISFRVEVDPTGGAKIRSEDDTTQQSNDLSRALDDARARGRLQIAEILAGNDMLNAEDFASLLGTTRMTVNTKRRKHQILGLDGTKRGFRFPAWQVGSDGKPFSALPALFELLGGGPWTVYRFLMQQHPELDGLTAREALGRGRADDVLNVAEGVAQGTFA